MPTLLPFPHYYHPPGGTTDRLPVTRQGVRQLSTLPLVAQLGPALPEIHVTSSQDDRPVRGICGLLSADCFTDGSVRPHEHTLTPRLLRQEELVLADGAALGKPVLLTVPSLAPLWSRLPPPTTPAEVTYRGGQLSYALFSGRKPPAPIPLDELGPLVIADGHHRAYTHAALAARGLEPFARIPVVIVGADELSIGAFLRVVETALPAPELLDRLRDYFTITPLVDPAPPARRGEWLMSYRDRHYRLHRSGEGDTTTDPAWLIETVLPAVFGITDVRSDPRIRSVEPPPPQERQTAPVPEPTGDHIVMLGYPVSRQQFFDEVSSGRVFPPKSTRFTPRIPSGLLVWIP